MICKCSVHCQQKTVLVEEGVVFEDSPVIDAARNRHGVILDSWANH